MPAVWHDPNVAMMGMKRRYYISKFSQKNPQFGQKMDNGLRIWYHTFAYEGDFIAMQKGGKKKMGLEFYGSFPCKVREKVSSKELLALEKARDRANAILQLMRNDPDTDKSIPESDWTFGIRNGNQIESVRIGDLLKEAEILTEYEKNCKDCPYSNGNSFGCGGTIPYPISAELEEWIVMRLPDDLDSKAGQLLLRAIRDIGFDGMPIDEARGNRNIFCLKVPVVRKWENSDSDRMYRISSSQILHMIMASGNVLNPTHVMLIAYFLGFLDDDFDPVPDERLGLSGKDGADIAGFIRFLKMAVLVSREKAELFVEP